MDSRGSSDTKELVGSTEAAKRLGLSAERIRQMAKAGMLPGAVGRLGRQDVWRWSDLETWAISNGRLAATVGSERQPVRAWQPGTARMRKTVDQLLKWASPDDAVVHVRIWEPIESTTEPPVALLGDLEDARSVSNSIEDVVATVTERLLGDRAVDTQFYEYAPDDGFSTGPVFHHVTFAFRRGVELFRRSRALRDYRLSEPHWRQVERDEIERLTGETLELYTPRSYTVDLVRAALQSSDTKVMAILDPEGATIAGRACLAWDSLGKSAGVLDSLGDPSGAYELISAALANRAVTGREAAAKQLTWQDPDAPILLRVPELPQPELLRSKAERTQSLLSDHRLMWQTLSAVRLYLSRHCERDRLLVVPAVAGGYSRLEWWEAGVDEEKPENPYGLARLETEPVSDLELKPAEFCHVIEATIGRFLYDHCTDFRSWDVPALRPTGPLPAIGPATQKYLESIEWAVDDRDRISLRRLQGFAGSIEVNNDHSGRRMRFGRDMNGSAVLLDAENKTFWVEWPVGTAYGQLGLKTRIWADPPRRAGPAPVFLFDETGIRLLPSSPRRPYPGEYTWGYSGTGPRNLSDAIIDTITHLLSTQPTISPNESWHQVVAELVHSGRSPGWQIADIIGLAAGP